MSAENLKISRRGALAALGAGVASVGFASSAMAQTATGDTASLESAVEALRQALVNGDGEVLKQIVDNKMTYSHSDGRVWTKHDLLENIAGKKRYLSIKTSAQSIYIVGHTGIVRHTYDVLNNGADGKTSTSHISVLLCWVKPGKQWKLLARAGTNLPT